MTHHPAGRRMRARGFTLVELLIAMALTLILVYAVAQFYAFVGETVRDGRAQIEMGGNLRQAASRLQQDFAELTVRVGGRIDPGQGMGVLELWEGIASDSDPTGSLSVNAQTGVPAGLVDLNGDGKLDGTMLGDCDDILVMTIRSQGDPFVGRHCYQIVGSNPPQYAYEILQSNLAEVIWFTTFKDVNADGVWQSSEPRFLVRRQLLIIPGIPLVWPPGNSTPFLPGQSVYHHNDISCHAVLNGGNFSGFVANSLSDLSQRENRCIHQNLYSLNNNGLLVANQGNMPNTVQLNAALTDALPLTQQGSCSLYSLDGVPQFIGEDKMLSNLLAFDVRVYDPYAGLWADNLDVNSSNGNPNDDAHGVLSPGDPGYAWAVANAVNNGVNGQLGSGAYVDLWYNRGFYNLPPAMRNIVLQNSNSAYSWAPQARNYPGGAVWETWTTAYEKDGYAQGMPQYNLPYGPPYQQIPARASADYLVDGLDNDNSSGVDDPGEAETRPPYPVYVGDNGYDDNFDGNVDDATENSYSRPIPTMLRGIEVRIRIYEPGTRQTRQVTVATDFIPE